MLVFARVELHELRCNAVKGEDAASPYLWAVLLQVDDDTLAAGGAAVVAFVPVGEGGGRTVIADGIRDGGSAVIPSPFARFPTWFRPGLIQRDLIFVAVLWDQRDTPGAAVDAGYGAFLSETPIAISNKLFELSGATGEDRDSLIEEIKGDVASKVEAAIKSQLSILEEIGMWSHVEWADRLIAADFVLFEQENVSKPFTLSFQTDPPDPDDYTIESELVVTIIPCEAELIRVESLQQNVFNTKAALRQLAHAHGGEPTPEDEQKAAQLEHELANEEAKLAAAQAALKKCRDRVVVGPAIPAVSGGG